MHGRSSGCLCAAVQLVTLFSTPVYCVGLRAMSQYLMAFGDDKKEYQKIMSFGGMCFVENNFLRRTGYSGPSSMFKDAFTTPAVIASCVQTDFRYLLDPLYYEMVAGAKARHALYSSLNNMVSVNTHEFMKAKDGGVFGAALHQVEAHIPPMFHHLDSAGGLNGLLEKLHRRAQRTRTFLRRYEWKVLFWATAIP